MPFYELILPLILQQQSDQSVPKNFISTSEKRTKDFINFKMCIFHVWLILFFLCAKCVYDILIYYLFGLLFNGFHMMFCFAGLKVLLIERQRKASAFVGLYCTFMKRLHGSLHWASYKIICCLDGSLKWALSKLCFAPLMVLLNERHLWLFVFCGSLDWALLGTFCLITIWDYLFRFLT